MLDLAGEGLAEVLLGEDVLEDGEGPPLALVVVLGVVALLGGLQLGGAEVPSQAGRRIGVPGLALEGLRLWRKVRSLRKHS